MDTDTDWEWLGKNDPYFGVLTHEKFRTENLDDAALNEFFESGVYDVKRIFSLIRKHIDPGFQARRVLEFGCGTGRLLIPMSKLAERVTGLDVSSSMLDECKKNCGKFDVTNFSLCLSDDDLSHLEGLFDLIYSHIVFQHIPVERGNAIFGRLLDHLAPGGVAALHFNYAKEYEPGVYGNQFSEQVMASGPPLVRVKKWVKKCLYGKSVVGGTRVGTIHMNTYLLNDLVFELQRRGVENLHLELCDHGGEWGAILLFRNVGGQAAPS